MSALPLHYSFGLSILHTHLAVGASMVLTSLPVMSREFWDDFKRFGVTSFSGVPYHYEMLRRVGFLNMELPALRMMTQAGGKLNVKYVELFASWCAQKQIEFYVMYGQTEATARISYMPPQYLTAHRNSMGIAIPGGELSLTDEEGNVISASDVQGELVYRGENVMMGYATSSEDLRFGDALGGVLHTGDMAKKDAEGFFTITGRMKRFLKMFGNRVNLDEVEQLLKTHGFEALVGGEDNRLIIAMLQGGDLKGASAFVAQTCGIHHSAIVGVEVEAFSVSESGKVEYAAFFKPYLKGE
jgi:acyl-coenzyme A synthetase/AMP-(fatty) acid ligase